MYRCVCINKTIRISDHNEVPVNIRGESMNLMIIRRKKFIQKPRGSSRGDPFASMNICLHKYCRITLRNKKFIFQYFLNIDFLINYGFSRQTNNSQRTTFKRLTDIYICQQMGIPSHSSGQPGVDLIESVISLPVNSSA